MAGGIVPFIFMFSSCDMFLCLFFITGDTRLILCFAVILTIFLMVFSAALEEDSLHLAACFL